MRIEHEIVTVVTEDRLQFLDLTKRIRDLVRRFDIREGLVVLNSLHTTTALFINEWQEALIHDVKAYLANAISKDGYYRHNDPAWSDCDRHNADSHLRTMLLGMSLTLQVADGDVVLGEWQSIIMAELDGPRERSIRIQVMGIASDK